MKTKSKSTLTVLLIAAASPVHLTVSGIGNAMATCFEARACQAAGGQIPYVFCKCTVFSLIIHCINFAASIDKLAHAKHSMVVV